MPEAPDEEGWAGDEDAKPAPFFAEDEHQERREGDHHDVEREEIAAAAEEENALKEAEGAGEISHSAPDIGQADEDFAAENVNTEDVNGAAPEAFVGGGSAAVVLNAGPEDDTDAEAGDEDEPPCGEAGVFAEKLSEEITKLDILVIEVDKKHVDEAQSSPEIEALIAGRGLAV